ncbi:hypothetical protein LDENG_00158140 [Lucifuga dentata]|nr:hypothetical protein LDENG_00158140 [Lucifuga dentata]
MASLFIAMQMTLSSMSPCLLMTMDQWTHFLDINSWMSHNFLQLNQDKTEVLITGSRTQREKLATKLNTLELKPSQHARNLGVIFDLELNFKSHVQGIAKSDFYHLKNISKVRSFL